MKVEIITIGDELLIGQITNTNAAYLSKHLTAIGLEVKWATTVGDDADDLKKALSAALKRSDVVITTGGLGPTHDDITKNVAADYFESDMVFKPEIVERLKHEFAKRGIKMAAVNEGQATVPEKASIIENPVGTAPGLLFEKEGKKCIILPGVPSEMQAICEATVFPMLKKQERTTGQKTIRTTGIAESTLFERLDLNRIEQFAKVAFMPRLSGVDIRLTAKGKHAEELEEKLSNGMRLIREKVGKYIYGYDDEELEEAVAKLLFEKQKTVAVAESCTGGLLAHKLTNISGSSDYFERGVVAYSNEAKMDVLGVPRETLEKHGAVSPETAVTMAEGVRQHGGVDFGISTTGIAGPTGGTKEKPVGLLYVGVANEYRSFSKKFVFFKDRLINKERSVQAALNLLRQELIQA